MIRLIYEMLKGINKNIDKKKLFCYNKIVKIGKEMYI